MPRNPYIATMTSLIAIGVWHELSVRYVIWGMYHGIGIIFVNKLKKYIRTRNKARGIKNVKKVDIPIVKCLKIFATANYFFFGYIIISQESFMQTLRVYGVILFGWMG